MIDLDANVIIRLVEGDATTRTPLIARLASSLTHGRKTRTLGLPNATWAIEESIEPTASFQKRTARGRGKVIRYAAKELRWAVCPVIRHGINRNGLSSRSG